jgi:hypothetical protein
MAWIPFWMSGEWEPGLKAAIVRKVVSDGILQAAIGDRFMHSEPPSNPTFPLIDFYLYQGEEDAEIPRRIEVYRITPWARSRDVMDAIAERVIAVLHNQPISGAASSLLILATTEDDSENSLFSKALDFRIVSYPA